MDIPKILLIDMHKGESGTVLAINSLNKIVDKLNQLGIREGVEILLLRSAPLDGPFLVRVSGREIAIGYELCDKILVGVHN